MNEPKVVSPLPTAKPKQLRTGAWILRVVVAGERLRLPLCEADATAADVARAHRKVLASWPAIVARVEANQAAKRKAEHAADGPTFGDVAKDWTSGKIAKDFPDHAKVKRSVSDDVYRLNAHVLPTLKDIAISKFTIEDAEAVMSKLGADLSTASRRHVAQLMIRVLALSVYPLKLRASSPIPKGFLPKVGARVALSWLYPEEEAKLVSHNDVPKVWRLLFGMLTREGMRLGEALALKWTDLDLDVGTITLDVNKTDEPRAWPLADDVRAALTEWKKTKSTELVFTLDDGAPLNAEHAADILRAFLKVAGVDRAELHARTDKRRPLRVHDLRASFVTMALASGQNETWVRDRTGHTTSEMMVRYRRQARHATELGLQWFTRLDLALNGGQTRGQAEVPEGQETSEADAETTTEEDLCTRGESNSYALRRRNLNPVRMPIPPLVRGLQLSHKQGRVQ